MYVPYILRTYTQAGLVRNCSKYVQYYTNGSVCAYGPDSGTDRTTSTVHGLIGLVIDCIHVEPVTPYSRYKATFPNSSARHGRLALKLHVGVKCSLWSLTLENMHVHCSLNVPPRKLLFLMRRWSHSCSKSRYSRNRRCMQSARVSTTNWCWDVEGREESKTYSHRLQVRIRWDNHYGRKSNIILLRFCLDSSSTNS